MAASPGMFSTLIKRGKRRFAERGTVLSLWQTQAELFYPERADFNTQAVGGAERYKDIFAGEPIQLRDRLQNGIGALMRSSTRDWFKAKVIPKQIGDLDTVKACCEQVTDIQRDATYARAANFQRAFKESDGDYVTFGNSVLLHTGGKSGVGLYYKCLHLRDVVWFENEYGEIDEVHEKICDKTIEQWQRLMDKAGGQLPEEWRRSLREGKGDTRVEVIRIVLPKSRYNDKGRIPGKSHNLPWAVIYCAATEEFEMHCDAFLVFPYLVRRWATVSGELEGRSPCTGVAMADTRILNRAQIALLESLEKAVDPPVLTPHDGIVGDVEIHAGARINYDAEYGMKARDLIDTLEVGDVRLGLEFTRERRLFLTQCFYGDILKRLPDKTMTAFEAAQWLDEYITEAGPVFAPMEAENAQLLESGLIRLLDGSGKPGAPQLPELPQEAQGREVSYEIDTAISIAMRKQKAQQADDILGLAERIKLLEPEALDNFDLDRIVRDAVEGRGSHVWLRPQADIDEERQQRAMLEAAKAAAAAAAMDAQMQGGAAGAPAGAAGLDQAAQALGMPTPRSAPMDLVNAGVAA